MDSPTDNSAAARAMNAIHQGNLALLEQLLGQNPGLATARVDGKRTLLHVVTDWPGHYPNSDASVATLIAHGAEVNAQFIGDHSETPLHWAASTDDVRALDALLDKGAETEARGGVIGGGTPLADAVAWAMGGGSSPCGARCADDAMAGRCAGVDDARREVFRK
jgi:uncharacterized protein